MTERFTWTALSDHLATPDLVRTLNTRMPRAARAIASAQDTTFDVERNFGAVSGLTTDSTIAIQTAIDAQRDVGHGMVYLPGAIYLVSRLHYYSVTCLVGSGISTSGVGGCVLYQKSGTATPVVVPSANKLSAMRFEGFGIYAGGNASNTGGLDLTGATDFVVRRLSVAACRQWNIRMLGGTAVGDAGFATFETVHNVDAIDDAWQLGSSATDQPDGLNFTDCRTITGGTATALHYLCTGGRAGPGSHSWKGCTFEIGPNAITVDAAGAGQQSFVGCRFENTGMGGLVFILYGLPTGPFAQFVGCSIADGGGGLTWTDHGPLFSQRIGEYGRLGYQNSVVEFQSLLPGGGRQLSGSGTPPTGLINGRASVAGDRWSRTDTPSIANQREYICTVGGNPSTWVGIL